MAEWYRTSSHVQFKFATATAVLVLSLLVTLIPSALSYRTGAPSAACSSLTPNHGVAGQDENTLPFRITTDVFRDASSGALLYTPGSVYNGNPLIKYVHSGLAVMILQPLIIDLTITR